MAKSNTAVLTDLKSLGDVKGEILQIKSPVIVAAVQEFGLPDVLDKVRAIRDERFRLHAAEFEYNQQLEVIRKAWTEFDVDQTVVQLRADIKDLHDMFKNVEVKDDDGRVLYTVPQICPVGEAADMYNGLQEKLKELKVVFEHDTIAPLLNQLEGLESDHQAFLALSKKEQGEWDIAKQSK